MKHLLKSKYIVSDPEILGGTPVFKGTRVPVEILFDYIKDNSIEEFLKGYPQVTRQMVNDALTLAALYFSKKSGIIYEGAAR